MFPFRFFPTRPSTRSSSRRFSAARSGTTCAWKPSANKGDIRTTWIGETPVIVTRDDDGAVHAMVNRCAHKGALVCLKDHDNRELAHLRVPRLELRARRQAEERGVSEKA